MSTSDKTKIMPDTFILSERVRSKMIARSLKKKRECAKKALINSIITTSLVVTSMFVRNSLISLVLLAGGVLCTMDSVDSYDSFKLHEFYISEMRAFNETLDEELDAINNTQDTTNTQDTNTQDTTTSN